MVAWDQFRTSQLVSSCSACFGRWRAPRSEQDDHIRTHDTFIEPAVAYNSNTNQYFITWRHEESSHNADGRARSCHW